MKKFLLISLLLALFANPGWCFTIDGGTIDVGGLDELVAAAALSNSGPDERDFFNDYLGTNYETDDIIQWEDVAYYVTDQDEDTYAFYLGGMEPNSFVIKNAGLSVLYLNNGLDGFLWGVFSTSVDGFPDMNIPDGDDGFFISHVAAPVPEPSTLLLLGGGLVGLAFYSRKRNKK